jgi:hypothetical protein
MNKAVDIRGKMFRPKLEDPAAHASFTVSKLFQNIFGETESKKWFTIRDARNYPRRTDCRGNPDRIDWATQISEVNFDHRKNRMESRRLSCAKKVGFRFIAIR